jgi:Flp pilus assembly protein TadG
MTNENAHPAGSGAGPDRRRRGRPGSRRAAPARSARQRGMVTAETALALLALVFVAVGMMWVVSVVALHARCVDAARDTARAIARGESLAASRAEGLRSVPAGSTIVTQTSGGLATVDVQVDARPSTPIVSRLPPVRLTARAVVALEPGVS